LNPSNAIKFYSNYLSEYEKGEIYDFNTIYYFNTLENIENRNSSKKERFNKNFGYDDERGDYRLIVHEHINYRYEISSKLGKGSFG